MTEAANGPAKLFPVIACALLDSSGRVLVQQRPPGRDMAGLWEFPGGKMEAGERPETALVRELREELAIDVMADDLRPLTFASEPLVERHLLLLLYTCRTWIGEPRAMHATELRWVRPADLAALPMPPADAPFAAFLRAAI